MFIRNGVKSILRERGRTVLFSLLIILLTVTLILSSSVLLYTKAVTDACDDAYRSIALVEYMGSQYPAEDEPDAAARAAAEALTEETILSLPGVTAWTGGNTAFAYLEGYARRSGTMPYNKRAIIVVNNVSDPIDQWVALDSQRNPIVEEGKITYYTCNVKNTVYFHNGQKGPYIDILPNDSGFVPEKGKSYVLNGYFVDTFGTSREVSGYPMNGYAIFKIDAFLSSDELPYADYVEGEEIPDVFLRASEQYRILNNYIHVIPCHDVNDVYAFHQNELQLIEGHMPDPGTPYACVVSKDIADLLELKPGDTFSMDEIQGTEEERYRLEPTGKTQSYTVSGIIDDVPNYRGTVWVIRENAETPLFGYLLGTMSLSNRKAVETVETLQALVPEEIRVTLLDQGYINAVQPFREVEKTATNVLLVCSVGIVAVLLLFAFLYIGRQHIAVKIMVSMGTPGGKMALWFLSGALVICGVSSILGTVLGISLRPKVLRMIAAITAQEGESFLWYSETVLGVVKELTFDPQIPLWPSLLTVPAIIAVALLFCLWFLRIARRGGLHKRGKSKVRVPRGKSSSLGLGGLGFSLLSIRRGGLKSLVVPLVSMVLTVTVLFLGGMYQGWQNELDNALKNTPVEGMVVSLDGRYHSGLSLSVSRLRMLLNMEGIKDASVSNGYLYWLPEDEPNFSDSPYGQAHRQEWIAAQPEMVTLNSMLAAQEFYYTAPSVTWLDGWDETALSDPDFTPVRERSDKFAEEKLIPAVCSKAFLEKHNMILGDTFSCLVLVEHSTTFLQEIPLNIRVVGSYVQQWGKSHMYVPLACHIRLSRLTTEEEEKEELNAFRVPDIYTFRTCRFTLSSNGELDTVRQQLKEQDFNAVGYTSKNRTTILLRDGDFLRLVENMERNIAMGKVMSAVLSFLVVLLGFIISWIMIFSRRREFALMRGCGVPKRKVFASFFLEQLILSLAGCLVGCLSLFRLYAGGMTQPLVVTAYLICYLLGTTISIRMIGKTDLMKLLTIRE